MDWRWNCARPKHYLARRMLLVLLTVQGVLLVGFALETEDSPEWSDEDDHSESYPPVEQGRAGQLDICEEEVREWSCVDLLNNDRAVVTGPKVSPDYIRDHLPGVNKHYDRITSTLHRVTHVYSEGHEIMVQTNVPIRVTCSYLNVRSPTTNCSEGYLMINSKRYCNLQRPPPSFTFMSSYPGSQESMIVLKTHDPQHASYSCELQVMKKGKENIIDLTKAETYDLAIDGGSGHQDIEYQILAPKKSYVVLKCPVFEVQDYWPCKNSYIVVNLHRYCHFPTAHDVEVEIPPTRSANIRVKMASSQHDRIRCTLTRIAGKATACSPTTKTPTYPEEVKELRHGGIVGKYPAEVCVNMMANPIVKITSPPRDEMDTTMDIDIRYRIMSVPKMVHFLWCQSFDLNTDCSKESLYWFDYNTRLCGRTRHREFEYKYGAVEDAETYSLRYRKSVGVSQGSFACYIYREPRPKGTYTLDLFSSQSATIEKDALKRMFHHRSQTITYNVLAPPDSVVTVTCPVFNVQSDEHCSDSYLKINDVVFCNANQPGTRTVELTYNNAVIVFRDGTNANNNFRCIFQRGESSDACAVNVFNETTPSLPLRMSTMFTPETELPTTSPGFGFTTLTGFPGSSVSTAIPFQTTPRAEKTSYTVERGTQTSRTLKHTSETLPIEYSTAVTSTSYPRITGSQVEFPSTEGRILSTIYYPGPMQTTPGVSHLPREPTEIPYGTPPVTPFSTTEETLEITTRPEFATVISTQPTPPAWLPSRETKTAPPSRPTALSPSALPPQSTLLSTTEAVPATTTPEEFKTTELKPPSFLPSLSPRKTEAPTASVVTGVLPSGPPVITPMRTTEEVPEMTTGTEGPIPTGTKLSSQPGWFHPIATHTPLPPLQTETVPSVPGHVAPMSTTELTPVSTIEVSGTVTSPEGFTTEKSTAPTPPTWSLSRETETIPSSWPTALSPSVLPPESTLMSTTSVVPETTYAATKTTKMKHTSILTSLVSRPTGAPTTSIETRVPPSGSPVITSMSTAEVEQETTSATEGVMTTTFKLPPHLNWFTPIKTEMPVPSGQTEIVQSVPPHVTPMSTTEIVPEISTGRKYTTPTGFEIPTHPTRFTPIETETPVPSVQTEMIPSFPPHVTPMSTTEIVPKLPTGTKFPTPTGFEISTHPTRLISIGTETPVPSIQTERVPSVPPHVTPMSTTETVQEIATGTKFPISPGFELPTYSTRFTSIETETPVPSVQTEIVPSLPPHVTPISTTEIIPEIPTGTKFPMSTVFKLPTHPTRFTPIETKTSVPSGQTVIVPSVPPLVSVMSTTEGIPETSTSAGGLISTGMKLSTHSTGFTPIETETPPTPGQTAIPPSLPPHFTHISTPEVTLEITTTTKGLTQTGFYPPSHPTSFPPTATRISLLPGQTEILPTATPPITPMSTTEVVQEITATSEGLSSTRFKPPLYSTRFPPTGTVTHVPSLQKEVHPSVPPHNITVSPNEIRTTEITFTESFPASESISHPRPTELPSRQKTTIPPSLRSIYPFTFVPTPITPISTTEVVAQITTGEASSPPTWLPSKETTSPPPGLTEIFPTSPKTVISASSPGAGTLMSTAVSATRRLPGGTGVPKTTELSPSSAPGVWPSTKGELTSSGLQSVIYPSAPPHSGSAGTTEISPASPIFGTHTSMSSTPKTSPSPFTKEGETGGQIHTTLPPSETTSYEVSTGTGGIVVTSLSQSTVEVSTEVITPEISYLMQILAILRKDLRYLTVNSTVLRSLFIEVAYIGTTRAYNIFSLALTDLKRHCDRLDPSQRVIVAFEIARFLKTYGTKIPHNIVVQAVSVFLCAIDHKSIITKLFPKEAYVIGIAETVVDDLTPPDLIHLIHLLYAERNISAVEESPCAGILCEEVPESIMDTIDMLVDRYFPNSAPQKKWLIIDIARALNLQPEVDEDGDEMVYYKLGDYGVVLDELREPMLSEDEKALLTGKFFAEARKNAKANRKINVSDLEEVWKMGEGNLPLTAVRSFIALLKVVHAKKIALEPKDRARLLEIALRCDGHECTKLPSRDIHNLIFALCNVGIRDGFALSKEVKKKVSDFIVALKDAYIDSISLRRWKRSSELLKPKAHDYLSESSPSELKYLKGWLQAPINLDDHHFDNPGQGRSLSDPQVRNKTLISELFQSYTNEKSPKRKAMLAETLLDSYNHSFRILGAGVRDTEKFIVSVLRQLPATTTRQNSLVLGILDQCIGLGEPCINVTRPEDVAPLKVILQNMSLERSPNLVSTLAHKLEEAGKRSGGHFDLSWMQPRPSKKKSSKGKVTKQKSPLAERMKVPS